MGAIWDQIKKEPAVLLGVVASLIAGAIQFKTKDGIDWMAFTPVALGIITRFFVSPAYPPAPAAPVNPPAANDPPLPPAV
jgi:hypothetical protein